MLSIKGILCQENTDRIERIIKTLEKVENT